MGLIQLLTHNTFSATYKGLGVSPGFGWDSRDIQDFAQTLQIQQRTRDPHPSKMEAGPLTLKCLRK